MISERTGNNVRPVDTEIRQPQLTSDDVLNDAQNFSLVLGGPLNQLLRRAHLSDDALLMMRQRVIVTALLGWLPLLVLSAVQGNLWGQRVTVPFLLDLEAHIRLLIVVPLLVVAELVVHQRIVGQVCASQELIEWSAEDERKILRILQDVVTG